MDQVEVGRGKRRCVGHLRVTVGHCRSTVCHCKFTKGNQRLNIGQFRLTPGHLIGQLRVGKVTLWSL